MRLDTIEGDLTEVKDGLRGLNSALIGEADRPGFIPKIAAHDVIIEAHARNFRLIAGALISQLLLLLAWSLTTIYARLHGA